MALAFSPAGSLSLLAGAIILGLGALVLKARPRGVANRAFFLLATSDGLSSLFLELSNMVDAPGLALGLNSAYVATFIVFVASLVAFSLLFPAPDMASATLQRALVGVAIVGAVVLAWYLAAPTSFWDARYDGTTLTFLNGTGYYLILAAFAAATAFLVARLLRRVLSGPAGTHRTQATLILGGLLIGYASSATTTLVLRLRLVPMSAILQAPIAVILRDLADAAALALVLATVYVFATRPRSTSPEERRFILLCSAWVLVETLLVLAFPTAEIRDMMEIVGLFASSCVLAYAILRFEILGVDRRVRRVATASLAAFAIGGAFLVVESFLQNALQASVFSGVSSGVLANVLAAGTSALLAFPFTRAARRLTRRVAKPQDAGALDARRLEVYGHALDGALADGRIDTVEERVLARLRESLSITLEEHARLLAAAGHATALSTTGT